MGRPGVPQAFQSLGREHHITVTVGMSTIELRVGMSTIELRWGGGTP
ncbi:hypothetical protein [Streptomyces sp. NPDC060035]